MMQMQALVPKATTTTAVASKGQLKCESKATGFAHRAFSKAAQNAGLDPVAQQVAVNSSLARVNAANKAKAQEVLAGTDTGKFADGRRRAFAALLARQDADLQDPAECM